MPRKRPAKEEMTLEAREIADLLARLLDKSLIFLEEGPDGGRFRLQELVREYGRDLTYERGEAETFRRRHRDYFTDIALCADRGLSGPGQAAWLDRLETEHDNLRTALQHALDDTSDPDHAAVRLAAAIWRFWYFRGYLAEGRNWLVRALSRSDIPPVLRAKALNGAGSLARESGDYAAARALHEESIELFTEMGDEHGLAAALGNLGNLAVNQGDYDSAERLYQESLALCRKMGDRQRAAYSLNNLGVVARHQGDPDAAWALYEEALSIHRELSNRTWQGITLNNLGALAYQERDYPVARKCQRESLIIRMEIGDRGGMAHSLEAIAALTTLDAEDELRACCAVKLLGAADALRRAIGAPVHADEREEWQNDIESLRERLGDEAFDAAWEEGRGMPAEAAVSLALDAAPAPDEERAQDPALSRGEETKRDPTG